ncbi:MAG: 50S ribosomal protein L25/general stress protein Ctc [Legionellaceae bacterium]|nr:50S ribosomal protein L25/general stress protein Ctc [Legionellaceae bacterium]
MSTTIMLEAETRAVQGKGASRRLRRLENKIPAIIYGSEKKPQLIHLSQHKVIKVLESEAIYSSVFNLHVDGKKEQVILKDLQRHPYKPVILHMDFQRVSAKDVLVRMIPLHFINGEESAGHKAGGVVNHTMTQVEIRCEARYLPEFIEVDLIDLQLDDVLHLSHIKLPAHVEFAVDPSDVDHDLPVVGIHVSKAALSEEAEEAAEAAAAEAVAAEEAAAEEVEAKVKADAHDDAAPVDAE